MSADWLERASHLIEQSRKTAASVVLAIGLAVSIAVYGRENWPAFTQLASSLQTTLAIVMLLGCYSLAVLVVGLVISIFQAIRGLISRKRAESAQGRQADLELAEHERVLRAFLPELVTQHLDLLGEFQQRQPGYVPSSVLGPTGHDWIEKDLVRLGFIIPVANVGLNRTLFEMTPAAARIVPDYLADYRRRAITRALEQAGEHANTLLQLFAQPEPPPGEPRHERLRNEVYSAIYALTTSFVLVHDRPLRVPWARQEGPILETISVTPDAISLVEEKVLHGNALRTTVVLDLSQIDATGASGGGASPRGPLRPILPH